ncbi:MAG: hypothetical protein J1F32_03935 [Erysipelotrichales bacterium]|nr:hypothetical protein [Erysipelotrichales bacterium]
MKLLKDIRIFIYDECSSSFFSSRHLIQKNFNLISTRLAKFLATQGLYTNGDYDHIYLIFRESKDGFNVLESTEKLEKELNWIKGFYVEISKEKFSNLDNGNNVIEFYELLNKTLSYIFPSSKDIIESSINLLIEYGENIEIGYKCKSNGDICVNLKYRLLDNCKFIPIIIISNGNGDVIKRVELAPASELGMFGEIRITKTKVTIMHKKLYIRRNCFPIKIDI